MKTYYEDDIVTLSDKLMCLLTDREFNQKMLNTVGRLLKIIIYYIQEN